MEIEKELKDISWLVDEPTYRADTALSYSTLSTYERTGFDGLDHLFDKKESPSLTFGSAVDSIITGGEDEFNANFAVLDINITDSGMDICRALLSRNLPYDSFMDIPEGIVSAVAKEVGFWKADKWDTKRYAEVLKTGNVEEYYNAMHGSERTAIDRETYNDVLACVKVLRESPATSMYFAEDDLFSPIKRYYQLKFKATFYGVPYRCMADLLLVDYESKVVYFNDLKTSGHPEWNFMDSFMTWNYMIQSRLYWRIIRANMDEDPYFKNFKLSNCRFIVVNRKTLTPLVWEFPLTKHVGTLVDNKGNEYRDPFDIGKELYGYLNLRPAVPNNIDKDGVNTIDCLKCKENI